jgi:hypothetical protein
MLRHDAASLVKLLTPLPAGVSESDIRRAWILIAVFDLDGVDAFTAPRMLDAMSINTLADLAKQSPAAMTRFSPRWLRRPIPGRPNFNIRDTRNVGFSARDSDPRSDRAIGQDPRPVLPDPIPADATRARADSFENLKSDAAASADDAALAAQLTRLHRFQAAAIRGQSTS